MAVAATYTTYTTVISYVCDALMIKYVAGILASLWSYVPERRWPCSQPSVFPGTGWNAVRVEFDRVLVAVHVLSDAAISSDGHRNIQVLCTGISTLSIRNANCARAYRK